MFGYIKPYEPFLRVIDLEKYKSYYCGLCRELKKSSGNFSRLYLTYDLTFFAIFFDALSPNENEYSTFRCFFRPSKKKIAIVNNKSLRKASTLNSLFSYHKAKDDLRDDKDIKSFISSKYLLSKINKFKELDLLDSATLAFESINSMESSKKFSSIDEIADPFAKIVGKIFENIEGNFSPLIKENLYNFGYCLAKWIYLIDAIDDIESDTKNEKFNPLIVLYKDMKISEIRTLIEENLIFLNSTCSEILDNLPLYKNEEILQNVVDIGMMDKMKRVLKGE